ncbi:MAG TPA: ATP-binding protein [Gemmatimonadales bacterium]|nr:ATP-binding protein [Gemmatimonadales bacterium]
MRPLEPTRLQAALLRWRGPWAVTGWLLILLAVAGVVGWVLGIRVLVQPFLSRPPLRPAAAVGLFALGIASLAMDGGRRRVALIGAAVAIGLGAFELIQLATGLDTGLDRAVLLFQPRPNFGLPVPGTQPLSVAAALGLVLAGAALATVVSGLRAPGAAFVVGVVGSTLVALNLALLAGQLLGLSPSVQFGPVVGSSPQDTVGLLSIGLCLASSAWSRDWTPETYPGWIPVAAGLASLTAVLFLWRALIQGERDDEQALLDATARAVQVKASEEMGRVHLALWRVAWFSSTATVGSPRWLRYVEGVVNSIPGMSAIAWVRSNGTEQVIVPQPTESPTLGTQLGMQVMAVPRPSLESSGSIRHFSIADSAHTLAMAVPHCDLEQCPGFVIALVRVNQLLATVVSDSISGYHRSVAWRGQTLVASDTPPEDFRERVRQSSMRLDDMTWDVAVWPTAATRERALSDLPELVLAFGLFVSGLLAVSLQLGRTVKANARTAEQARLSLALGRSMDRAWSWEVPVGSSVAPEMQSAASGQELRRGRWTELIHPDDRRRVEALLLAHLEGRTTAFEAQYRVLDASGEWHWRVDRGHVAERGPYGTPILMLGVSGDVSERRRVDEERDHSERRFRAIFDSAYQFQGLLDLEGRVLEANPTALAALGPEVTIEKLRGTEFWRAGWWPTVEEAERIRAACREAREGEIVKHEVEIEHGAGQRMVLDFSVKPIRDAEGRVVQLLAEGRDITARRRAENELREVETLTTMGRLAARVAHEINNPLAGIQNSFLLLRDAISPSHPHYAYVGAIEREIERIADVTRQLYETYRPDSNGTGPAGVRTVIGDAVAFLEQVNRQSGVRIRANLEAAPAFARVPESVLRQSVYNLVQNAVEASPPGGTVTVEVAATDAEFVLRVRDEGPGIPVEAQARIFEPFVSSKARGVPTGGMGIGLSLVRRSVQALGGTIEIASPPDGGAEFIVHIPMAERAAGVAE